MVDRRQELVAAALAALVCACSGGDDEETPEDDGLPKTNWSGYGFDMAASRASDDTTITRDNVATLERKWEFPVKRCTATPAVVGGVVYFGDWSGTLFAKRVKDGADVFPPTKLAGGFPFDASPTVSGDTVFIGDGGAKLYAVNRKSGALIWEKELDDHSSAHLFSSPVVVDGLVLIGVASQEVVSFGPYSFRGSVVAVEAETGEIRWKQYVTGGDVSGGPGVSVWSSFAVDPDRKLAFIGTGQPYERPGSIYADSLLAVRYETGEFAWHRQYTADDVFTTSRPGPDFDIGATPNLFTHPDGRDAVFVGDKGGKVAAFERETGNELWSPPFVTISTGSAQGGVMDSAAYHDGVLYVASNDRIGAIDDPQPGNEHVVVAIQADTGAIKWQKRIPMPSVGGVTWANGVIYKISTDGRVYALDAENGDELWTDHMNDIAASGPTVAAGRLFTCHGFAFFKTVTGGAKIQGGIVAYGLP